VHYDGADNVVVELSFLQKVFIYVETHHLSYVATDQLLELLHIGGCDRAGLLPTNARQLHKRALLEFESQMPELSVQDKCTETLTCGVCFLSVADITKARHCHTCKAKFHDCELPRCLKTSVFLSTLPRYSTLGSVPPCDVCGLNNQVSAWCAN
jgi:hypothetical protein